MYTHSHPHALVSLSLSLFQVLATFENISAEVLYDTLQDSEYRSNWDEAILDDHVICSLEGSDSDICYNYSSEQH